MSQAFEKELQNNSLFRFLYQNSNVNALLVADTDGYILHLNEAFRHTYGYTIEDLQGKHGRVLFTEEDQKKLMPEIEVEKVNGQGFARDRNYVVHRNGSCIWTDGESMLTRNEKGTPFIIKIIQNIHEQKVMEKFLRDARAFSDDVVSAINDGLLVIDLNGKILKANSGFSNLFDKEKTEVEGLFLSGLEVPLFASEKFTRELQNIIAAGSFTNLEMEYRPKAGGLKILSVRAGFIKEEQANTKILIVLTDITVEKKFAEELENQVKDKTEQLISSNQELENTIRALKHSNTQLEEFAHAASHDLKEPIRKIYTFSDRLKSTLASRMTEEEGQLFARLEKAAERMKLLVDDLLEYSHVSYLPHQKEAVDLNKKLALVLDDLEVPIRDKQAKIMIDQLPVVQGYRRQLQQLFQNLIGNAVKYSKPGTPPHIHISSQTVKGSDVLPDLGESEGDKKYYLIEVRDNGIGFEQANAGQIFKMFHRLHGKGEYSGTGIGLSIARKVVDNHQGYIWAEGEPGKGAKFKMLLPAE